MRGTEDFFASMEEIHHLTESHSAMAISMKRLLPHRRAEPVSLSMGMPELGLSLSIAALRIV